MKAWFQLETKRLYLAVLQKVPAALYWIIQLINTVTGKYAYFKYNFNEAWSSDAKPALL